MGRTKNQSTVEVQSGLYMHQKANGYWYYNFTLGGIAFRGSAKTKDRRKAQRVAEDAYQDAEHQKRSGKVKEKVSFARLKLKYLDSIKDDSKNKVKTHTEHIDRYLSPFFKKIASKVDCVSKIDQGTLSDYLIWRRNQSVVKNATLNREAQVLNAILGLAYDYKWLDRPIRLKNQTADTKRRPDFTREQLLKLGEVLVKRIKECIDPSLTKKQKALMIGKYRRRCLLRDIILIISDTGLRVSELKVVRWKDVLLEKQCIQLDKAGKMKSSRLVGLGQVAFKALKKMKDKRVKYAIDHGQTFDQNEYIQSLENGKYISDLRKGFDELLEQCGFVYKNKEEKHTLGSLRHTYATLRLTSKTRKLSTRALIKQMGTSQRMIDNHYAHDETLDYLEEILSK